MGTCELCGRMGRTGHAIVEGGVLNVCGDCLRFGNAVEMKQPSKESVDKALKFRSSWKDKYVKKKPVSEDETIVVGYGKLIKRARMKMGMKQDDAAKAIAEKTSVLQKIESGGMEPSLKLARKLEQFFGVKLVAKQEKVSEDTVKEFNLSGGEVTIGDLVKMKKR
tara:strand:+ start:5046 stop:5540 length:495 start_codon:yes stop_codon:yes gene_type:complete